MKISLLVLCLTAFTFTQCKTTKKMTSHYPSDTIILEKGEENALFLAINHVDILKIKGVEFYHLFLIILTKNPDEFEDDFKERAKLFYDVRTRNLKEEEVDYFDNSKTNKNTTWETTISASSECAYDPTAKKLGNLTKAPNYDRLDNGQSGKRIFVKKIASNDKAIIEKILEFERRYDNSLKYSLLPETAKKGYNSNSYFRGALEYAGLTKVIEVPSCFKSPGLSKGINFPVEH